MRVSFELYQKLQPVLQSLKINPAVLELRDGEVENIIESLFPSETLQNIARRLSSLLKISLEEAVETLATLLPQMYTAAEIGRKLREQGFTKEDLRRNKMLQAILQKYDLNEIEDNIGFAGREERFDRLFSKVRSFLQKGKGARVPLSALERLQSEFGSIDNIRQLLEQRYNCTTAIKGNYLEIYP